MCYTAIIMTELINPAIIGILTGLVSGCIPGIGNFAALLILFPYLINLDPLQIIILYTALTTISQYIGSIPAITFGIPGESSSMPAVIESRKLKNSTNLSSHCWKCSGIHFWWTSCVGSDMDGVRLFDLYCPFF